MLSQETNFTPDVKYVIVSATKFEEFVESLLGRYGVSTTSDYKQESKVIIAKAVSALLGSGEYEVEFKALTTSVYNAISSIEYKEATDVANILVTELSNLITYQIQSFDNKLISYIQSGTLKGNILVLTIA